MYDRVRQNAGYASFEFDTESQQNSRKRLYAHHTNAQMAWDAASVPQVLYVGHLCGMFVVASLLCATYLHAAYWRARLPPMQILLMYLARLSFDIFDLDAARRDRSYLPLILVAESALVAHLMHSNSLRAYDLFMYRLGVASCLGADALLMLSWLLTPECSARSGAAYAYVP